MLRSVWEYRQFIKSSILNEFKTRFAQSKCGGLWMLFNPLSQVLIYALILSNVLAAKLPGIENKYAYSIYLMAGTVVWTLFSEVVTRCLNVFIEQGNLMKKMSFPRVCLPAIVVGSSILNSVILLLAVLVIFTLLGESYSLVMLSLIPIMLVTTTLAVGLGLVLGVFNVFLRDVGQVVPIIMQVMFWFTPIVYPVTIIPESYRHLLQYNPLYPLVESVQKIFVYGETPPVNDIFIVFVLSLLLMLLGLFLFRKSNEEMVDVL